MGQYLRHSAICTKDGIVEVGKKYQYKEGEPLILCDVEIVEDKSDKKDITFTVKVLKTYNDGVEVGEIFDISANRKFTGYYSGMWRLFDADEYSW